MTELPNRKRIDQINDWWKEDAPFSTDADKLPQEASNNLSLISKYGDIKTKEIRILHRMQIEVERFRWNLTKFYRDGVSTQEELQAAKDQGWEIPASKPLKPEVKYWVDNNDTMIEMMLELAEQNDIVEKVEWILVSLRNRGASISETMKMVRYNRGGNF